MKRLDFRIRIGINLVTFIKSLKCYQEKINFEFSVTKQIERSSIYNCFDFANIVESKAKLVSENFKLRKDAQL